MNKRFSSSRQHTPPMGGSSLLVIFAVLCLTMFTLLALGTVQADQRLAQGSLQAMTQYYDADWQAEEILARLRAGETVPEVSVQDHRYSYSCPISDTQQLMVEVTCHDGQWTVLRWQAVTIPTP